MQVLFKEKTLMKQQAIERKKQSRVGNPSLFYKLDEAIVLLEQRLKDSHEKQWN